MLLLDVQLELVGVLELLGALLAAQPLPVVLHVEVQLERLLRLVGLPALRTLVRGLADGFIHGRLVGGGGLQSGGVLPLHHLIGVVNGGGLLFILIVRII